MDRPFPHNHEAERSVLGSILAWPAAYKIAAQTVHADDFHRDAHALIFKAMQRLAAREVTIDGVTLKNELAATDHLNECGGPVYIAGLSDGVPRATNVAFYAQIVREKACLRRVIEASTKLADLAFEGEHPAARLIERARHDLANIAVIRDGGVASSDEAIADYLAAIDDGSLGEPIPTGFTDLDTLVGGFRLGEQIIVAARPGVGKTSFLLGLADHASRHGRRALIFSIEMSQRDIAARLVSLRSGVPSEKLERKTATPEEYAQVSHALGHGNENLLIETASSTTSEVAAYCRRQAESAEGLAFVGVDFIQRLTTGRNRDGDEPEMAAVSAFLAALAKELRVCMVSLSQLNRAPEARRDKRPSTGDLRGSGSIEQDAHRVLLLFREELYSPKPENIGIAECIVAKNRNGPLGVVKLAFQKHLARFTDLAH